MHPKTIWANLASADLDRTALFYTQLGFQPNGLSADLCSILFGKGGFVINFFATAKLEDFAKSKMTNPEQHNEVIFSLSAESEAEVDEWQRKVKEAGGSIFMEPQPYELGYTFGVADPDGHKFNVLYWPGM